MRVAGEATFLESPRSPRNSGRTTGFPAALRRSRSSSGIGLPQAIERARRARLDGAPSEPEDRGGLVLGELEEVAARDHEPLWLRKCVDRRQQQLAPLAVEKRRLGGGGRLPR